MLNAKYDYSSVHVNPPETLAQSIINWGAKHIADNELYITKKDAFFGRENEIHVTVLYGIHSDLPDEVIKLVETSEPIQVKLGKVDIFTNPHKFDVVVINVISDGLNKLHTALQKVKFTDKYGIYKPHITIAYIKKGNCIRHRGLENWEGKEFTCNHAIFSSKTGSKLKILFRGIPQTPTPPEVLP
jgi:2'-5' RNA ligase